MVSGQPSRLRVLYSDDPLQLSTSKSSDWLVPQQYLKDSESNDWPTLGMQGSWLKIAQESANFQSRDIDQMLSTAAWHIVAQIQLGDCSTAAQTLSTLGDLDAPEYTKLTDHGEVSRVPFAIRRAACECQARLGNPKQCQDALYSLLSFCQNQQQGKESQLWRYREDSVAATLFCHHYRFREYDAALGWLSWLQARSPQKLELQLTVGCIQLSMGQIQAASATLQAALKRTLNGVDAETSLNKIRNFRGLLLLAQNNLQGAISEFQAVLTESPGNRIAANNLSVCHVLSGKVPMAAKMLERSMQKHPDKLIHEFVVSNLAAMYNIIGASDSSNKLADWLSRAGTDDLKVSDVGLANGN